MILPAGAVPEHPEAFPAVMTGAAKFPLPAPPNSIPLLVLQ